ncbi:uncharacterized protein METZ01_LOCUS495775, partial [marine metagenome]
KVIGQLIIAYPDDNRAVNLFFINLKLTKYGLNQ